jgi:hypothetical protein
MEVDMDNPTFVPMVKVGKVLKDGDSIQYVELNNVWVFAERCSRMPASAPPTTAWCTT